MWLSVSCSHESMPLVAGSPGVWLQTLLLKHNRREMQRQHKLIEAAQIISKLWCWIGTGKVEAFVRLCSIPPPREKFSVTSVGVVFNQWGLTPPTPKQIEHCWKHIAFRHVLNITLPTLAGPSDALYKLCTVVYLLTCLHSDLGRSGQIHSTCGQRSWCRRKITNKHGRRRYCGCWLLQNDVKITSLDRPAACGHVRSGKIC